MTKLSFCFTAKLWIYPGKAAWHFLSVPKAISDQIRFMTAHNKRGWVSVPVSAGIGRSVWKTSIFLDRKAGTFMLPVKVDIRKIEGLRPDQDVEVTLDVMSGARL